MTKRAVTLDHVAARAGVSRQTASRAINDKPEIRAETRARVLAAAAELGYEPNAFARGLVTHRSQTVGLIVGDLSNPFFPDVARGVLEEAEANDFVALVCNLGFGWDTIKPLRALAQRGVDGFIVFPAVVDLERIAEFAQTRGPMVVVDAPFDHEAVSTVHIDWVNGAASAAAHLASTSRTVAILTARPEHASPERTDLFREHAERQGMFVSDDAIVAEDMTFDGGQLATARLFAGGRRFDAIFAYNDLMALGAMSALAELGIDVPGQCRVIGCDDIDLAAHVSPPLTSLRVDRYRLGTVAMRELQRRIEKPDESPAHQRVDVSLVARSSSEAT